MFGVIIVFWGAWDLGLGGGGNSGPVLLLGFDDVNITS